MKWKVLKQRRTNNMSILADFYNTDCSAQTKVWQDPKAHSINFGTEVT